MSSNRSVPALTQVQARQLAGKRWVFERMAYRFGDYDPREPGQPPWKTGAEGIAYPLLGTDGFAAAYLKFFDSVKVTAKRVARTEWLIQQQIHTWIPELGGAPRVWADTRESTRADGVEFEFAGSFARAVRGNTWLETKANVVDGTVTLDCEFRKRCVANLLRALVVLERAGIVHGDLSPNNIIVDRSSTTPACQATLADPQ